MKYFLILSTIFLGEKLFIEYITKKILKFSYIVFYKWFFFSKVSMTYLLNQLSIVFLTGSIFIILVVYLV